jgi:osmotically-inducible protein OsmY
MATTPLAVEVERRLHESAELHITVEEDEGRLVLTGIIGDETERATALELVAEVAPGAEVDDNLELDEVLPNGMAGTLGNLVAPAAHESAASLEELAEAETLEPGDFTTQETLEFGDAAAGPTSAFEDDEASEGDEVFVPPVDPVGTDREVIGGLQSSAVEEIDVERSADGELGDEAIRDAVLRELREDAVTTALAIDVEVSSGRVILTGTVTDIQEAETAEEVVARIPGVTEVEEQLEVQAL